MVDLPVNVANQPVTAQTAATAVPEPVARPESIQARNAPSADSQKPDQRTLQSRDEDRAEIRESGQNLADSAANDPRPSDPSRGQNLDITV